MPAFCYLCGMAKPHGSVHLCTAEVVTYLKSAANKGVA